MCFELTSAATLKNPDLPASVTTEPILLYDHTLGLSEYFLMEYRSSFPVTESWDAHYDRDIPADGLAVYYISQDRHHTPVQRHSYLTRGASRPGNEPLASLPPDSDDEPWDADDDGVFDVLFQGKNHQLDTLNRSTDVFHDEVSLLMVPPLRVQNSITQQVSFEMGRFGQAGVWSQRQGVFRLQYPGGREAKFLTQVGRPHGAYPTLLPVALSDRSGRFPSEEELSRKSEGTTPSFRGTADCFRRAYGQVISSDPVPSSPIAVSTQSDQSFPLQWKKLKAPSCQIQSPFGGRFQ
jgi:hypothetical protein